MTTLEAAHVAREKLLNYLAAQGIAVDTHDHPVVTTVEAQFWHKSNEEPPIEAEITYQCSKMLDSKAPKDSQFLQISALLNDFAQNLQSGLNSAGPTDLEAGRHLGMIVLVQSPAKHVAHLGDSVSKNLFLKDKKDRLYLITALASTPVDMKKIALRLGVGKSGIRFAPEETLQAVLQVPLGCATPFAVFNESAKPVALLLDKKLQSKPRVYHHPLTNDATTGITPHDFDKFLRSLGREPIYVDLEAELILGKDGADLAQYALEPLPSDKPSTPSEEEKAVAGKASAPAEALPTKAKSAAKPKKATVPSSTGLAAKGPSGDNVTAAIDRILQTVASSLLTEEEKALAPEDRRSKALRAELQSQLTLFKNAAYTNGFLAGQVTKPLVR